MHTNKINNLFCYLISFYITFSCSNINNEMVNIFINPYSFNLFCSNDELYKYISSQGIELQNEDSHIGLDKGVVFNFFGSNKGEINYYFELYSKDNYLQGVKTTLYPTKLSDSLFFKKIDQTIIPYLRKYSSNNSTILFDTMRYNKSSIKKRNQYTIYIRTKEIDNIMGSVF